MMVVLDKGKLRLVFGGIIILAPNPLELICSFHPVVSAGSGR